MRKKQSKAERLAIYQKTNGHCAYCGCEITPENMQADHVMPLHCGGADELENLLPACRSCNHYKSSLTLEKFRYAVQRMPIVLARDSVTYRISARFGMIIPNPHRVSFYFERNGGMTGGDTESD